MVAPGRGRWLIGLALVAGVLVPSSAGGDAGAAADTAPQWFVVAVEWTNRMAGAGGPCRAQGG